MSTEQVGKFISVERKYIMLPTKNGERLSGKGVLAYIALLNVMDKGDERLAIVPEMLSITGDKLTESDIKDLNEGIRELERFKIIKIIEATEGCLVIDLKKLLIDSKYGWLSETNNLYSSIRLNDVIKILSTKNQDASNLLKHYCFLCCMIYLCFIEHGMVAIGRIPFEEALQTAGIDFDKFLELNEKLEEIGCLYFSKEEDKKLEKNTFCYGFYYQKEEIISFLESEYNKVYGKSLRYKEHSSF